MKRNATLCLCKSNRNNSTQWPSSKLLIPEPKLLRVLPMERNAVDMNSLHALVGRRNPIRCPRGMLPETYSFILFCKICPSSVYALLTAHACMKSSDQTRKKSQLPAYNLIHDSCTGVHVFRSCRTFANSSMSHSGTALPTAMKNRCQ